MYEEFRNSGKILSIQNTYKNHVLERKNKEYNVKYTVH